MGLVRQEVTAGEGKPGAGAQFGLRASEFLPSPHTACEVGNEAGDGKQKVLLSVLS